MDLREKVALVLGGSNGCGKEYCKELFRQGCKVSICDIHTAAAEVIKEELTGSIKDGDRMVFFKTDITDYPQVEEAFKKTISKFGEVDILINSASVMNDRLWELEVDVNLNGVIRGLLLAIRYMGRDAGGAGGIVVNSGSSCSARPLISMPIYTATKHAVAALTRTYGDQYHVNWTGIKVFGLCPAPPEEVAAGDCRRRVLTGDYDRAWKKDVECMAPIKLERMGRALIEIIQKAPSGTSWLVESDRPPKEIPLFP